MPCVRSGRNRSNGALDGRKSTKEYSRTPSALLWMVAAGLSKPPELLEEFLVLLARDFERRALPEGLGLVDDLVVAFLVWKVNGKRDEIGEFLDDRAHGIGFRVGSIIVVEVHGDLGAAGFLFGFGDRVIALPVRFPDNRGAAFARALCDKLDL